MAENNNTKPPGERLQALETKMEHVATREDIERAKNFILMWLVPTVIAAAGAIVAALKL